MRSNTLAALMLAFLLAAPGAAAAGFVIHEQEYDSDDPGLKAVTVSYIQKSRIRFQDQDDIIYYLWDLSSGQLTQVNTQAKVYASGTLEDEAKALRQYLLEMDEEEGMEEGEPPLPAAGAAAPKPARQPRPTTVTRTEGTAEVAGYKAVRYEVRQADTLQEEVWISKDLDLAKELDYPAFKKLFIDWMNAFNEVLGEEEEPVDYYLSEPYLKLFKEGYAVRQVEHYEDGSFIREVVKVEVKDIPEAEFQIPKDFRKVSHLEFMEIAEE